ncbi:DUF4261 domain-containing protein [Thermogutta sp.]|jgi:hypothetical protein|uniref:DUF4261 domain-containing protein n=1 Tax=Thermogutta sp. TaxID=1962930 RepID=UPI0032201F33
MEPPLAMVLLKHPAKPSLEKLQEAIRANWEDVPPVEEAPVSLPPDVDLPPFQAMRMGDTVAFILSEAEPIPEEDLEPACLSAWYWPDAQKAVKEHTAHLVVILPEPPQDPLERYIILTQITAALAQITDSVAVFWPRALLVHKPEDFINSARQMGPGQFPLELWVGFHGEVDEDQTLTLFTRGMAAFSLPEIEVYNTRQQPQFVYERVYNIAYYLLENGPVIHDGETVGMNEDERYKVRIGPSRLEPRIRALQVEM